VKKPTLKKTSSTPAARAGLPAAPDKPLPPLAKRISKKDRDTIRKRLIEQHNILVGSIDTIEAEYLGTNDNQTTKGGDEADQASTALTADLSLRLAESESKVLKDINLAISKLDDGSYGVCEVTGAPIEVRRLLAMPWARLSLEAQERVEQQQLSYDESFGWVASDEF
ncbi:MAG: TraR/DksA C4-type zinc finger protein, partial [Planctomycetes bacterium]|nr:TraR/DksA C4-type zinc finger protein [Planctomycetota bacterium]